jgi:hypothetical protein
LVGVWRTYAVRIAPAILATVPEFERFLTIATKSISIYRKKEMPETRDLQAPAFVLI